MFALVVYGVFLLTFGMRRIGTVLAYGSAYASHLVLDFVTTKEGGAIELLWPFSREGFMLGWWGLSEMMPDRPLGEILTAAVVELALFAPIFVLVVLVRRVVTQHMHRTT